MNRPSGLRYDRTLVNGREEWLMRIGPENGHPVLFVPPLLEEMNRTRALLAGVMRILGVGGFLCTLIDLPGTGESERALESCRWEDWREAVRAAASLGLVASFRGGALIDAADAAAWWRFAPVAGASLLRDLDRAALTAGGGFGGHQLPDALASGLRQAVPAERTPCRTVRLASDPKPADIKLDGPALWRRSEPGSSSELAQLIASDISAWARQCGIC